jgi:hypothetical protein
MTPGLPETCAIAFKEWEGVCEALARGRQSVILRKGGIEEGPGGFVPEHPAFWLYPTRVHQAQQGLKPGGARRDGPEDETPEGMVGLRALAVVDWVGRLDDRERLADLDDLHVWTAETVAARYDYRRPGLWVLGVRVYARPTPRPIPVTPGHAGCKTWVPLETPLGASGLAPALAEAAFREQMDRLRSVLGPRARR